MVNSSTGRSPKPRRSLVGRTLFGKDIISRHSSEDLYQNIGGDGASTHTNNSSHHDAQYIKTGGKQILSFLKDIGEAGVAAASATISRVPRREGSSAHSDSTSQDGQGEANHPNHHNNTSHGSSSRTTRFNLRRRSQDPQAFLDRGTGTEGLSSSGSGTNSGSNKHGRKGIGTRPLQTAGSEGELCSLSENELGGNFTPKDLDAKYRDRANAGNVPAVSPVLEKTGHREHKEGKEYKEGKEKEDRKERDRDGRMSERGKGTLPGEKGKHVLENIRLDAMTRRNKDKHRGKSLNTESPFNSLSHSLDPEGRAVTFTKFREDNVFEIARFRTWLKSEYSIEYYLAWKEIREMIHPGQAIEPEKGLALYNEYFSPESQWSISLPIDNSNQLDDAFGKGFAYMQEWAIIGAHEALEKILGVLVVRAHYAGALGVVTDKAIATREMSSTKLI